MVNCAWIRGRLRFIVRRVCVRACMGVSMMIWSGGRSLCGVKFCYCQRHAQYNNHSVTNEISHETYSKRMFSLRLNI